MNVGKLWNAEELRVLTDLAQRRIPIDRIANVFPHRSREAIRQKLRTLGLLKYYAHKPDMSAYKELLRIYKG